MGLPLLDGLTIFSLIILLGGALREFTGNGTFPVPSAEFGTVGSVGMEIFTTFFYAFEAISLLLVVAMIGAVLLAKRRL